MKLEASSTVGSTNTPEFATGTDERNITYKLRGRFKISSATESFTLTDRIISSLRGSPGFHNPRSLSCALVEVCNSRVRANPGFSFSFRFTTPLYSRYQLRMTLRAYGVLLRKHSRSKFHIRTR